MPTAPAKPRRTRTKTRDEAKIMSEATRRLLKGIKEHSGKPLPRTELLQRGYTEEFIAKLEAA